MNEAEKNFKSKGNISKKFTIPMLLWEEWQKDCAENFNDTYHLKMQFDHEFRKHFQALANNVMEDLAELKDRVAVLEERVAYLEQGEPEQEEKKVKTFGE